jgi:putative lipoprotein
MRAYTYLIVLTCLLSAGCTKKTAVTPSPLKAAITGNVTYLERIALPPNAVVQVELQDVSRADAPATVLGQQTITASHQVPIPFRIEYDPRQVQEKHTYVIRAGITVENQLRWTNTTTVKVLTGGNPKENVTIRVSPAGS